MKNFMLGIVLGLCIFGLYQYDYGTDGAKRNFLKKQHFEDVLVIKINTYDSKKDLRRAYKEQFPDRKEGNDVLGYSTWYIPHDGTCNIYVPEPKNEDDLETWGHELAHCVYGSWHK